MTVSKRKQKVFWGMAFVILLVIALVYYMYFSGNVNDSVVTNTDQAQLLHVDHRPLWNEKEQNSYEAYSPHRISSVKIDYQQRLYIVDGGNNRIMQYDSAGKFIRQIGSIGQGPGELLDPSDLDVDNEGFVYIANRGNNRIEIFDSQGNYIKNFKIDPISTYRQVSVAVTDQKMIFINTAVAGSLISAYSSNDGVLLKKFGTIEQYSSPSETLLYNLGYLVYAPSENILYFLFMAKPIIQKYKLNGELLMTKKIVGKETRLAFEALERNQKKAGHGMIGWMIFFYGLALLPNGNLVASTEIGPVFYELDQNGNVLKKIAPKEATEKIILGSLACFDDFRLISANIYDDKVTMFKFNPTN